MSDKLPLFEEFSNRDMESIFHEFEAIASYEGLREASVYKVINLFKDEAKLAGLVNKVFSRLGIKPISGSPIKTATRISAEEGERGVMPPCIEIFYGNVADPDLISEIDIDFDGARGFATAEYGSVTISIVAD